MSLAMQLSVWGFALAYVLAVLIWLASVGTGRLLLPKAERSGSLLDLVALAGPWGLLFLVSCIAAVISSGTSMLTPVPLVQLGFWISGRLRRESEHPGVDDAARSARPGAGEVTIFFAVVVLAAQLIYLFGVMPYRGGGHWQMPHEDFAWWGVLSRKLAENGVESWSIATVLTSSESGRPILHWYHWLEFWLAGVGARALGLNALLVLMFSVYPLLVGMIALAVAAVLAHVAPWRRLTWVVAATVLCASSWSELVRLAGVSELATVPQTYSILNYTNYHTGILLTLAALVQLFRGFLVMGALLLALSSLAAPPLFVLFIGVATVVMGVASAGRFLGLSATDGWLRFAALLTASLATTYIWLRLSQHGLGPQETLMWSLLSQTRERWPSMVVDVSSRVLSSAVLALPYLLGIAVLVFGSPGSGRRYNGSALVGVVAASALVVGIVVTSLLSGHPASEAAHASQLTWPALLAPVGWAALVRLAVADRWRRTAVAAMVLLALSGGAATEASFRRDRNSSSGRFAAADVMSLSSRCAGGKVGYFSNAGQREGMWWISAEAGWAALSQCDFVRLNQRVGEVSGADAPSWANAAPAVYARRQGQTWDNSLPTIIGFAKAHGIDAIAESSRHPLPQDLRPCLEPLGSGGPFVIYRLVTWGVCQGKAQ